MTLESKLMGREPKLQTLDMSSQGPLYAHPAWLVFGDNITIKINKKQANILWGLII
jgi:hypothetical protein